MQHFIKIHIALSIFFLVFFSNVFGQKILNGAVYDENKKPLPNATITVSVISGAKILGFGFSGEGGKFAVKYKNDGGDSILVSVSLIGFQKEQLTLPRDNNPEIKVVLKIDHKKLPDVVVRNSAIYSRGDTINYNVKSFSQKQDMAIGDVIKRLPGIEVKDDGTIMYQGRPINKYYIEGMDPLDGKYGLANENIPANAVDQVQILENHQPVKALDSFAISNRAALNLKLNANAKNRIIGKAKAGVGLSPVLLDNELVPMKFGKKSQTIASYKYNNAGISYDNELNILEYANFQSTAKGNLIKMGQLFIPQPSSPTLKKFRYLFNDLHVSSINHLVKLSADNDVRINIDYTNDRQRQTSGNTITNFFSGDTIVIREQSFVRTREQMVRVSGTYTSNKKSRYIKNQLSANISHTNQAGELFTADSTRQMLSHSLNGFSNDFKWQKVKSSTSYSVGSFISYSSQPQELQIDPGVITSVLNYNKHYDLLAQQLSVGTFYADNHLGFSRKIGRLAFNNLAGISYLTQQFQSALNFTDMSNLTFRPDSFINHLKGYELQLYSQPTVVANFTKVKVSATVPVAYLILQNEQANPSSPDRIDKPIVNFNLNGLYNVNSRVKMMVLMSQNKSYNPPYMITDNYILSSYRSASANNGIFVFTRSRNLNVDLGYRDVVKSLFINGGVLINQRLYNTINQTRFQNIFSVSEKVPFYNDVMEYRAYATASKYIYKWKTSVAGGLNAERTLSYTLLKNDLNRVANNIIGINAKVNSVIKKVGIDWQGQYRIIRSGIKDEQKFSTTTTFNQNLVVNTQLPKDYILKAVMEQTHFSQGEQLNRTYYMADLSLRKKIAAKKLDVELLWQNIFNTRRFETLLIQGNVQNQSFYILRPSQVMLKVNFQF